MVKIVSRKLAKTENVYDIGVTKDHNFVLANGLIASNCFNKSHSTAYAYVAYQTAYLKANYSLEYMAAVLTANSGDQDKVQKYLANCQKFNIEVEPPNINQSEVDFTPLPKVATKEIKDKILVGLSAVKNVGEGAIEAILKARKEGGEFKSLADLCDRVNLNALNSRTLESLIKCGAFDKIEANRHQLIKDLEGVMKWAQDRNKDRNIGQLSLFDNHIPGAKNSAFDSVPKSSPVSDFPAKEKLEYEKEILGFYVSDHPLKYAQEQNQIQDAISIAQMKEKKSNSKIKLVVMLAGIKPHVTKKGDPMAFIQVEDMTGQLDAVVFPKVYQEIKELLTENSLLVLKGKVDNKDDESQLLVESAETIEKVMADAVKQEEKPVTELDNYQNESRDEEIKKYQDIGKAEKPVEQLETQRNLRKTELSKTENSSAKQRQIIILELSVDKIPEDNSLFEQIQAILKEQSSGDEEKAKVAVGTLIFDDQRQQLVQFGREFWVEDGQTTINRFIGIGIEAKIIPFPY